MNKYKLYMIVCIITLMITVILTGTYAYFTWSSKENTTLTMTIGELADVTFKGGPDINTTSLAPVFNYTDGEKTSFEIINKSTSETALYTISLNINNISPELVSDSFKYTLVRLDSTGKAIESIDGSFLNSSNNTSITLTSDYLLNSSVKYEFYLYIDGNLENDINIMNKNFKGSIGVTAEATTKPTLTNYIDYKYNNSSKEIVVNNNIDYIYAPGVSLMNDGFGTTSSYSRTSLTSNTGNIRYYGKDPNNYIYFNCDDYNNQTKDTCELWRIIGLFDGKLKLVRVQGIGGFSWDNKDTTTGAETVYGKNDWSDARLMKLLNPPEYYAIDSNDNGLGQSLYWNSEIGTCYAGLHNATKTCDFTKTGIKNDITRNIIEETTWNLGGCSYASLYLNQIYECERGDKVATGRTTTWTGKIGLIYPSDYGYGADFNQCDKKIQDYHFQNCYGNDWLYFGGQNWFLTPERSYDAVMDVTNAGNVRLTSGAYQPGGVHPSLFLNSNININKGDGSSSNPYQIIP